MPSTPSTTAPGRVGAVRPTDVPARAFAVSRHAPRFRRPTDVILLMTTAVMLAVVAVRVDEPTTALEAAIASVALALPSFLDPLWQLSHDAVLLWALFLLGLSAVRRHWTMLRDLVIAIAVTVAVAAVVGRLAGGAWPDLLGGAIDRDPPVDFPAVVLAVAAAMVSVASPHLSRPMRHPGRWLVVLGALGSAAQGLATPSEVVGALALGWLVAAGVHLVFGSPGAVPSLDGLEASLATVGVDARPYDIEARRGVVMARARHVDGRELDVRIHGRDAWDAQLMVSLWRFLFYRDSGPTLALTRQQQVEHVAFVNLFAERNGVPVAPVLVAASDARGDALLVTERVGAGLAAVTDQVDDAVLAAAWGALRSLHAAGISHGALLPERVRVAGPVVTLSDFGSAEVTSSEQELDVDRAQLIVTTAVVVGADRAVAAALDELGSEGLGTVSSYVQPAALPQELRRQADLVGLEIDDLRTAVVGAAGGELYDLQRLRRLTLGRVLTAVLLFVAGWTLVSSLTDIGLETIFDEMANASVPLLLLAFVIGQTPRFATAVALSAAAPMPIPLARLTALQFAICFINLAMPSTAARVAVNIRFFQRSGVEPTAAVAIGALDGFSGFVAQIFLIITILGFGLGTLDLQIDDTISAAFDVSLVWVVLAMLVVAIAAVALVPRLRAFAVGIVTKAWALLGPLLHSPRRLVTLLGANLVAELLFSLCSYTVLLAYGQSVSYADVVLVNVFVALFAGLMPVPGGIGVTEAALTAGYVALGVDDATAFAAAITYRMITFYIPPIFGVGAFRWLQRQRYL